MSKKKKKISFILSLVIIITIILIVTLKNSIKKSKLNLNDVNISRNEVSQIDMNNLENAEILDGTKINTSKEMLKDKTVDGMKITNIQLIAQDGISNFTARIENNSGKVFEGDTTKVTFINQDGSVYAELEIFIPKIEVNETYIISAGTKKDLINAYDFTMKF